jgi:hypothetical protein
MNKFNLQLNQLSTDPVIIREGTVWNDYKTLWGKRELEIDKVMEPIESPLHDWFKETQKLIDARLEKFAEDVFNFLHDLVNNCGIEWGQNHISINAGMGTILVEYNGTCADDLRFSDLGGIDTYLDAQGDECDADENHPQNAEATKKISLLRQIDAYLYGSYSGERGVVSSNNEWNYHLDGRVLHDRFEHLMSK